MILSVIINSCIGKEKKEENKGLHSIDGGSVKKFTPAKSKLSAARYNSGKAARKMISQKELEQIIEKLESENIIKGLEDKGVLNKHKKIYKIICESLGQKNISKIIETINEEDDTIVGELLYSVFCLLKLLGVILESHENDAVSILTEVIKGISQSKRRKMLELAQLPDNINSSPNLTEGIKDTSQSERRKKLELVQLKATTNRSPNILGLVLKAFKSANIEIVRKTDKDKDYFYLPLGKLQDNKDSNNINRADYERKIKELLNNKKYSEVSKECDDALDEEDKTKASIIYNLVKQLPDGDDYERKIKSLLENEKYDEVSKEFQNALDEGDKTKAAMIHILSDRKIGSIKDIDTKAYWVDRRSKLDLLSSINFKLILRKIKIDDLEEKEKAESA